MGWSRCEAYSSCLEVHGLRCLRLIEFCEKMDGMGMSQCRRNVFVLEFNLF